MNVQAYTVNQARSLIRNASSSEKVEPFLRHPNANVVRSARFALNFKLGVVETRMIPETERKLPFTQEDTLDAPVSVGQAAPVDPEIEATAAKYEISVDEVLALVSEKGSLTSAKRSLAARKGASTRKAKAA